jgi:hypothetical protein
MKTVTVPVSGGSGGKAGSMLDYDRFLKSKDFVGFAHTRKGPVGPLNP